VAVIGGGQNVGTRSELFSVQWRRRPTRPRGGEVAYVCLHGSTKGLIRITERF
jgi:hypothetical protein